MKAAKEFKIGEYAIGGIIKVVITGKVIQISALDYKTKEEVSTGTVTTDMQHLRALLDDYLNELTSSYYAGKVMEWIETKVAIPSYW